MKNIVLNFISDPYRISLYNWVSQHTFLVLTESIANIKRDENSQIGENKIIAKNLL